VPRTHSSLCRLVADAPWSEEAILEQVAWSAVVHQRLSATCQAMERETQAATAIAPGNEPVKYRLSTLPASSTTRELVPMAKLRWIIERDKEELQQERGLEHCAGLEFEGDLARLRELQP